MLVFNLPDGYPGKSRFLGRPWVIASRIGVSGLPAVLQSQGQRLGMRPSGCCRGTMLVPRRVGGYCGKTRFLDRLWVQESGGRGGSNYG